MYLSNGKIRQDTYVDYIFDNLKKRANDIKLSEANYKRYFITNKTTIWIEW